MGAADSVRQAIPRWLPLLQLLFAAGAWGLWYLNPSYGWPVAVALAPMLARLLLDRQALRTSLDGPMLLFALTAVLGVWAAYDRDGVYAAFDAPVGWQKLWGVWLGVLIYYALAGLRTRAQCRWALVLWAGFGALVGLWFVATNDWAAEPSELALITRVGEMIQAQLPNMPGHRLNANVTGGLLAPILPLSLGLATEGRFWNILGGVASAVIVLALFLTTSFGAWLAIGGGLALGVAWWLSGRMGGYRRRGAIFAALAIAGCLAAGAALVTVPILQRAILASGAATNRFAIYSQAALLIRDYLFTGCGLGNFATVHSTYALLIHVPILPHAHALWLNIPLEQGILGGLAALAALAGAGWLGLRALTSRTKPNWMLGTGLLSLATLLIHGVVDDPLYSSRGVALLWVPAGIVVASTLATEPLQDRLKPETQNPAFGIITKQTSLLKGTPKNAWRWVGTALVGLVLLLSFAFRGNPLARWHANLGAVAQTWAELQVYNIDSPGDPTLDQVRQRVDLSAAEARFQKAISLKPDQVTAHTRLAHIALARGAYERALAHARTAWDAGHRDRVTRLLLSDALVAAGQIEEAAELARGLDRAEDRLRGQAWYRYWVNEDYRRAAYAWRTVLALDPTDGGSAYWLSEAERLAAKQ